MKNLLTTKSIITSRINSKKQKMQNYKKTRQHG